MPIFFIKTLLILFNLCVSVYLFSQEKTPDYHPPLKIPLLVAGNFGELRSTHFHTGVDFKTQQREGLPIYAIERGYVSRVKISSYGYGKVIYINHPNGKTSVYAHCSKFIGKIGDIILAEQYRQQQFAVELFFDENDLPVQKGEVIALSGNTGGSTAPHLHFEIRDTKTEYAQNPLIYAFNLPDKKSPQLNNVKIIAVNKQGYIIPDKVISFPITTTKLGHTIEDTLKIPASFCSISGGIGFALDMVDYIDGSNNKCGVYGTRLIVNGDTIFGHQQDEISFEHMHYVYSHRFGNNGNFHKMFRNENNPLNFYINDQLGIVFIKPGETKNIQLIGYDPKGNISAVSFVLQIQDSKISENFIPSKETFWYPQYGYSRKNKLWEIIAEANTIFEPICLDMKKKSHICQAGTPLNKSATIRIKLEQATLPTEKYYIAVETQKRQQALTTVYNNGWLEAKTRTSGEFSIQTDTQPPQIKLIPRSKNKKKIQWNVIDTQSGIFSYQLFIDQQWHLLEYEYKENCVFFEPPPTLKGKHHVKVIVTDRCQNESVWQQEVFF